MALPTVTGRGFLLSDGVELKFSQAGNAWASLPLIFKNRRKVGDEWTHDKEIKIDAKVFGPLAEALADAVEGRVDLDVSGEIYTEEWEDKEGNARTSLRMNVTSAWPVKARERVASASQQDAFPF